MRKKLFAVIMSAMMMITFMPTMAFAGQAGQRTGGTDNLAAKAAKMVTSTNVYYADNIQIAEDYQSATADIYKYVDGTVANDVLMKTGVVGSIEPNADGSKTTFHNTNDGHLGQTEVVFCFADSYVNQWAEGTTMVDDPLYVNCYYYNMSAAKLVKLNTDGTYSAVDKHETVSYGAAVDDLEAAHKDSWKYDADDTTSLLGNYVQFNSGSKKAFVSLENVLDTGAELTIYPTEGYEDFADGNYTFNYEFDSVNSIRENGFDTATGVWEETVYAANNGSQSQTVELKTDSVKAKLANMKFNAGKKLGVKAASGVLSGFEYTGEDQKLTLATKGYVAQYYYKDASGSARAWHDEAPAMVNAETYSLQVRFAKEGTTNWTSPENLKVVINPLAAVFGFSKSEYSIRGTKFDAKKKYTLVNSLVPVRKVVLTDADKTVFESIVDKYVTFTEDHDDQLTYFEVTAKIDSDALLADKDATVKQFLKNYTFTAYNNDTVDVAVSDSIYDNVTAVNQTRTFHIKKAAKLKGNKTFKLKGDKAEYGTITYIKKSGNGKIKVASNGKVTVKKGLKKGTYTLKIKVKAGGDSEIKTLKVKIKK